MSGEFILFLVFGSLAVASALTVILHPHPVYSALALIVTLSQVSFLFFMLDAFMLGFFQLIVYAGAIMVLFLFVIMLLNLQREPAGPAARWKGIVLGVGALFAVELTAVFLSVDVPAAAEVGEGYGSAAEVSRVLFTDHVLSFELASILLLVAIVGSVAMAKRRKGAA